MFEKLIQYQEMREAIARVRKLKDRIDDMPTETFGKYWLLDELEAALDGIQ